MEHKSANLDNGIRFLYIPVQSPVTHLGLFVNAGTRDENRDENGLAHFIEHTIFKGTRKRKAYHILTRLESVGGELNAYTTKEETCIYASFLKQHLARAVELIADIVTNATFPEKEIQKEKDVILEEINSYKDSPAEEIYDVFEENLFKGHPLALNILGTKQDLEVISREKVLSFIRKHYHGNNMVICVAGGSEFKLMCRMLVRHFSGIPAGENKSPGNPVDRYDHFNLVLERNTFQSHCIIGSPAYSRKDPKRIPLFLLNNYLGGPVMNSRLNLELRERHGFTYNIESVFLPYTDTGVFSIYLGTDNGNLKKALDLVHKEIRKIRDNKLGSLQLSQAKKQLIGQIAIANESNLNRMLALGKAWLHDDKIESFDEIKGKILSVTAEEIREVANEIMASERLSMLVFRNKRE